MFKNKYLSIAMLIIAVASLSIWAACGGSGSGSGSDTGPYTSITIDSVETSGDLDLGGTLAIDDDGFLVMRLDAVGNPDTGEPYTESDLTFVETIESTGAALSKGNIVKFQTTLSCTGTAGEETNPSDIVFIIDSTGSMSDEIAGVESSINALATFLEGLGVNPSFAVVTFGDEVNTADDGGCNRPVQDFTNADGIATFLSGSVDACGGVDFPENPIAAVRCALPGGDCGLTYRTGASKAFILFTDAVMHVEQTDGSTTATQCGSTDTNVSPLPGTLSDILDELEGTSLYPVTNFDSGGDLTGTLGCGDPANLVSGAGVTATLTSSPDLTTLPLAEFLGAGFVMVCPDVTVCDGVQVICTVGDASGRSGTIIWNGTLVCRD